MEIQRLVFPSKDRCEIETLTVPDDIGPSDVLVRNRLSLISAGTELAMFTRTHRGFDEPEFSYAKYPFYPGYAAVGEVLAVGDGVTDLAPGASRFPPWPPCNARAPQSRCLAAGAGGCARFTRAIYCDVANRVVGCPSSAGLLWRERARDRNGTSGESVCAALRFGGSRPGSRGGSRGASSGTGAGVRRGLGVQPEREAAG